MFVSLEFTGFTRNADGSIDLHGFLELNDKAPANAGTTGSFTASTVPTLVPDEQCTFSNEWTTTDIYVHWHECECGNKSDLGEHEFIVVTDREATESRPGLKHHECKICGAKSAQFEDYYQGGNNDQPTRGGFIGFILNIWYAIVNFFKSIFGLR